MRAEGSEERRGGETRRGRGSRSGRQEGSADLTQDSSAVRTRTRRAVSQTSHSRARDDFVPRPERAEIPVERGQELFRQRGEISIYSRVAGRVCPYAKSVVLMSAAGSSPRCLTRQDRTEGKETVNGQSPLCHNVSISFLTASSFLTCLFLVVLSPKFLFIRGISV